MKKIVILLLFYSLFSFSQGEANVWYFGQNAGLDFNSGTPVPLLDGQIDTQESCGSISDSSGQLLFYTDGRSVWNRNHDVMPNGSGLLGDESASQSGTIVPMPNSTSLYYIITTDSENGVDGFRYSIVDMTLNGGLGAVTSEKNILLFATSLECITVVKQANGVDYWVIGHGWNSNNFYAYSLTSAGLNTTPVTSSVGAVITGTGFDAAGNVKVTPSGSKLAFTSVSDIAQLFDFNSSTGVVSNPITLSTETGELYGIEFSPDETKLYISNSFYRVYQYDLTASDIPNSKTTLYNGTWAVGALQIASNGKIYIAVYGLNKLGVINNPNILGLGCNLQIDAIDLGGRISSLGLPSFNRSFFDASFIVENNCLGDTTQFNLTGTANITSASWDFGDGSPVVTGINPTHQYATAGDYNVTATVTGATGTVTKQKTITISSTPIVVTTISSVSICGTEGMLYDLTQHNTSLIGTQTNVGVAYFATLADATNHVNLLPADYPLASGVTVFFAKVYNLNNPSCHAITSFSVTLSLTPIANAVNDIFVCDDVSNDGIAFFDFNNARTTVLGSQHPSAFTVSFYTSQNDADSGINSIPLSYQNTSNPQTIYVRIANSLNTSCYNTTSFQIGSYQLPIAHQPLDMETCDSDENDGFEAFDLTLQDSGILQTQSGTDFTISYHVSQDDADAGVNPLPETITTTTNPQIVFARLENNLSSECYDTTSFELIVYPKPVLDLSTIYSICEGNSILIDAPLGFDSYQWSNGMTTNPLEITESGDYTLTVTKNYGSIACETTKSFVVYNSNIATITNIFVNDWTDTANSIEIIAEGDGDYEYSIDGIHYQDSSVFTSLSSGAYTVYVNDKKGCGFVSEVVYVLMYPKFFTPNGDGYNDRWKVKFSNIEPNMMLQLFDRYGKLITSFDGTSIGWDGTFDGHALPADDYWFVIKRPNGKDYKGHFALKR